jgi:hypothetical protein
MRRDILTESIRSRLERLPRPYDAHYGVVPAAPEEGPADIKPAAGAHNIAMKAIQKTDRIYASIALSVTNRSYRKPDPGRREG